MTEVEDTGSGFGVIRPTANAPRKQTIVRPSDERLRQIARDAVPSRVYSGNVKALRAVAAAAWEEGYKQRIFDAKFTTSKHANPYREDRE